MAKPAARILFLQAVLLLAGGTVVARSFWLQVVHRGVWVTMAANRRETDDQLNARRGRIYDRNGRPLAVSEERYHVRIALNRVRDTAAVRRLVVESLDVPKARVADEFAKPNQYFHGPYSAEKVEALRPLRGVRLDPVYNRQYPMDSLGDHILGRLNQDGTAGIEGMEKALDTLLQGRPGREHFLLDGVGKKIPAPGAPLIEPVAGHDVHLTIDADLQGIAEGALRAEVSEHKARGGDIVIIDVRSGELLAVASLRTDSLTGRVVSTSSAIVEPNQPGSTSKLFTVAALLRSGADTTPVFVDGRLWMQPIGRTATRRIEDVHPLHGLVTLGQTVKYSSNIAITKFSQRITPAQQYQAIRDFGFGTIPGLGFPAEAPGKLNRPALWVNDILTQGSLAQGYEWEASSVQIAAGYAALANHGTLLAPTLVREVQDEQGVTTWRHRVDTVRQAVPDSIAARLFSYLTMTEGDGGTGSKAQLDRFPVPGKTGTAKIDAGGYRSSFAGIFPADHPQLVVYVLIVHPGDGKIYGGDVAAPAVRRVLQQALLSTQSPLDRGWLTERAVALATVPARPVAMSIRSVSLPASPAKAAQIFSAVPNVAGQSVRAAVVALQGAGFQVRLVGRARVRNTLPNAGDSLLRGSVVTIHADSLR